MRADPTPPSGFDLSRRAVLRLAGMGGLAATTLSGCDLLSTAPSGGDEDRSAGAADALEAPQLADQVSAGGLPPLADRLPAEPLQVAPVDRPGQYGGRWRSALLGTSDTQWLERTVGYECPLRWSPDWDEVVPNVVESWTVEDGGRSYILTLRAGMKWSDGEPFGADDIVFAHDDVLLNEELHPVPPSFLVIGDQPAQLEKVDDSTVRFTFALPNALFPEHLANQGRPLCQWPRHYLQTFHAAYNPDAAALAEDDGFASWVEMFGAKADAGYWQNSEIPTLCAWKITQALGDGTRVVLERNPYYWKVDTEDRQLPYLDEVVFDVVSDEEVILVKAFNGELDMHTRHINTLENKPVLAENRETGDYRFVEIVPAIMNYGIISFNLTHENEQLREIFRSKDFRIGLSHGIDRDEINAAVFMGQSKPSQPAPREDSGFYDEVLATQYTDFDPALAAEHLDRAGLSARDDDGNRLRPDGEVLAIEIDVALPSLYPATVDMLELVRQHWARLGITLRVSTKDRALFEERRLANAHQANVWPGGGGLRDALLAPSWYFPFDTRSDYASLWSQWYLSRGASGDEPSAAAREQMQLYDQIRTTMDEQERHELFGQILAIAAEEFYAIGTVAPTQEYGLVRSNFHNVPASMPEAAIFNTPGPTNPEQYFVE